MGMGVGQGRAAPTCLVSSLATGLADIARFSHVFSRFVFLQGCNVMEDQDLREIGITDPQHRRKLLQAARSLPKVSILLPVAASRGRVIPVSHSVACMRKTAVQEAKQTTPAIWSRFWPGAVGKDGAQKRDQISRASYTNDKGELL